MPTIRPNLKFARPAYAGVRSAATRTSLPPAGEDTSVQSGLYKLGFALLLFDIFLTYSRLNETWFAIKAGPLSLTVAVRLAAFACALASGGLGRTLSARQGQIMVVFSIWLFAISPFSAWKGASFETLTKDWMPSFLLFLAITGLVVTSKDVFKILKIIAFAAGLISFLSLSAGASQEYGRLRGATGSLANANALALYILIGIPCALLLLKLNPRKIFLQVAVLPLLGMFLVILLRTASRSAMLNLLTMAVILFWTASIPSKARMLAAGALLIVGAMSFTPDSAIARLRLLMPGTEEEQVASTLDPEAIEEIKTAAEGSSEARKFVFTKALGHTIRNPVFGVGPGAFMAADAQEADREGRATLWRGTHNTFVQLSAETGIPGFAMFFAMLYYTARALLRIRKQTRLIPELAHLFHGALSLILILTSIALSGIFGHFAYGPFFPLIIAFGQVFELAAQREIAAYRLIKGFAVPSPRPLPRRLVPALRGRPV